MATTRPYTVVVSIELRFVEADSVYRGHVRIENEKLFGERGKTFEFEGPTWYAVYAAVANLLIEFATTGEAPAANGENSVASLPV